MSRFQKDLRPPEASATGTLRDAIVAVAEEVGALEVIQHIQTHGRDSLPGPAALEDLEGKLPGASIKC